MRKIDNNNNYYHYYFINSTRSTTSIRSNMILVFALFVVSMISTSTTTLAFSTCTMPMALVQPYSLSTTKTTQQPQHHHHHHRYISSSSSSSSNSLSILFANPTVNDNKNDEDNNDGNKKRNRLVTTIRKYASRIKASTISFLIKFKNSSRRVKSILILEFAILLFLFGKIGQTSYQRYIASSTPAETPTTTIINRSASAAATAAASSAAKPKSVNVPYSQFLQFVKQSSESRSDITVDNLWVTRDFFKYRITKIDSTTKQPQYYYAITRQVPASPDLIQLLHKHDISFAAAQEHRANALSNILRGGMTLLYIVFMFRMFQALRGNNAKSDTPGTQASSSTLSSASFDDIQGIDEAKTEVMELVDTLKYPEKYAILGARAPTGLLLEGPPGTGKTLLARATAASAGVPLIYCSGSDFVEMYVGRGAARVRRLFEKASKLAPCIIFIDELDAVGKARDSDSGFFGGGSGGRGNDEADQTLNQLLACMDGLDSTKQICVLAATNRKDTLDKALIRPGRFDRIVSLQLPNAIGRENILRVHAKKLPGFTECVGVDNSKVGKGTAIDLSAIAALTPGASGAELEYIVNEAAIRAVRRVSAAIRRGVPESEPPHVIGKDFEESLKSFFATRSNNNNNNNNGILKNVWK